MIIWSNIASNRLFCHFRYFGEEIWKKKHFGRFWSEKVKKTTKSPIHAENSTWRHQDLLMTPSLIGNEVDNQVTRDAPECFWRIYTWRRYQVSQLNISGHFSKPQHLTIHELLFIDHYSSFYYSSFLRSVWYSEKHSKNLLFTKYYSFPERKYYSRALLISS